MAEPPPNAAPSPSEIRSAPEPPAPPPAVSSSAGPAPWHGNLGPERQSLLSVRLLGVMFSVTFLCWGGAKLACNRSESPKLPPPALATDVFQKRPKDAALELQQRAATYHFSEALELAKGDAALELEAQQARCRNEPASCEERRRQSASIQTTAVLLTRDPKNARVRAESFIGESRERYLMDLEFDGTRWSVVRRVPDPG
jgi:hypothetical protein